MTHQISLVTMGVRAGMVASVCLCGEFRSSEYTQGEQSRALLAGMAHVKARALLAEDRKRTLPGGVVRAEEIMTPGSGAGRGSARGLTAVPVVRLPRVRPRLMGLVDEGCWNHGGETACVCVEGCKRCSGCQCTCECYVCGA